MAETRFSQKEFEVSGWTADGDYETVGILAGSFEDAIAIAAAPGYGRVSIIEVGDVNDVTRP